MNLCDLSQQQDYEQEFLQRRFSGGSQSYGGDSPRLSPCSSMGKLSKSDEQLSSIDQDSGQCSRNTSCETLGKTMKIELTSDPIWNSSAQSNLIEI